MLDHSTRNITTVLEAGGTSGTMRGTNADMVDLPKMLRKLSERKQVENKRAMQHGKLISTSKSYLFSEFGLSSGGQESSVSTAQNVPSYNVNIKVAHLAKKCQKCEATHTLPLRI